MYHSAVQHKSKKQKKKEKKKADPIRMQHAKRLKLKKDNRRKDKKRNLDRLKAECVYGSDTEEEEALTGAAARDDDDDDYDDGLHDNGASASSGAAAQSDGARPLIDLANQQPLDPRVLSDMQTMAFLSHSIDGNDDKADASSVVRLHPSLLGN
jgi:hypothetical protein